MVLQHDVSGYPTFLFFPRRNQAVEPYEGERTTSGLVEFLNLRAGTHRLVGGGLEPTVGRLPELDSIVARFVAALELGDADTGASGTDAIHLEELLEQLLEEAERVAGKQQGGDRAYTGLYLQAMRRCVKRQTTKWVPREIARLGRILRSGAVKAETLSAMMVRQNVLAVFDPAVGPALSSTAANDKAM